MFPHFTICIWHLTAVVIENVSSLYHVVGLSESNTSAYLPLSWRVAGCRACLRTFVSYNVFWHTVLTCCKGYLLPFYIQNHQLGDTHCKLVLIIKICSKWLALIWSVKLPEEYVFVFYFRFEEPHCPYSFNRNWVFGNSQCTPNSSCCFICGHVDNLCTQL